MGRYPDLHCGAWKGAQEATLLHLGLRSGWILPTVRMWVLKNVQMLICQSPNSSVSIYIPTIHSKAGSNARFLLQ